MYYSLLFHSSIDGHVGCFYLLSITDSSVIMNMCVLLEDLFLVLLCIYLGVEFHGPMIILYLTFLKSNCISVDSTKFLHRCSFGL